MAERKMMLSLAKLMIAVAWADGQVAHDELNALNLFLLRLKSAGYARGVELSGREWAELEMYISSPVAAAERERLLAELRANLRSHRDKQLALDAIREVVGADGTISADEKKILAEIEAAINETNTALFGLFNTLFGQRLHQEVTQQAPNREQHFQDFIRNRVYYSLRQRLKQNDQEIDIPLDTLQELGLAGALLAKVAHAEAGVSHAEQQEMAGAIRNHWQLPDSAASFVAEVAVSTIDEHFDTSYVMREINEHFSEAQRRQLLRAMFAVAAADGQISEEEVRVIRFAAYGINLSHQDYVAARRAVMAAG